MSWQPTARALMKAREVTQEELAAHLGVTRGTIGHWLASRRNPSPDELRSLANYLGTTASALMGDVVDGGMQELLDAPHPSDKYEFATRVHGAVLSAGNGATHWEHEEIDGSHAFTRAWLQRKRLNIKMCRVLTIDGNSMEPVLADGNVVLIDLADCLPIKSGKVYAISVDGEQRLKRLFRQIDGSLLIRSDNPDKALYPDEIVRPEHLERVRIIGRKRWHAGDDD